MRANVKEINKAMKYELESLHDILVLSRVNGEAIDKETLDAHIGYIRELLLDIAKT